MADKADRVTRTATDLYGSAVAEGARQRRSAKQQLDHWAVERAVSSRHTAARQTARALYDRRRAIGDGHAAALRNMFNRFLSQLHHCLATGQKFDPERAFPTHHDRVAA